MYIGGVGRKYNYSLYIYFLPTSRHYNPSNIFARAQLVKMRHMTQYAPTKIGEYPSDIPQFSKLEFEIRCKSCFKKFKMGERFAVVSEEDINLLVEKAVPENTKKSTSYAVNVF